MSRPTNKQALLEAAEAEFARLWAMVDLVPGSGLESPGVCDQWSVKDLLAHLHAWHELALGWEKAGSAGRAVAIPADGYSFAETPTLNDEIHRHTKEDAWEEIVGRLRASHVALLTVIGSYDDDDLFAKQRYPWTRSTSVGAYMVSATSSHYAWASKLIRRWAKQAHS